MKLFKRSLMAAAMATAFSAYADTANIQGSGMGLLMNDWVKAGVNANTGTLGSGGSTSPGLLFDPAGTGTFNSGYDYLTPGSPFDGFSLKVDGTNKTNNNTGTEQIAGQGVTKVGTDTLTWTGSATYGGSTWNLTNAYTLGVGKPYIDITTTIVAGGAATNVYYAKFIDPDSQGMPGDSSATDNVLGYGAIPSTNVAFSEATVSRYALGLYSAATNVTAGINGWNTDAASYNGAVGYAYPSGRLYGNGDDTIGLTFHWTSVGAGATLTASYAYIFGPSAFSAASSAVSGGAGGGTAGTAPGGGTLVDVGSATDAATSGASSTPTVTGTTTVNGTATHADTNGDSVVISTSAVAGDYSTRDYNTLTTTSVGRVTTTPRTIVTSWSDSSTTSAATTALTASETYYHAVDVTHADVVASVTPDAASRTHVDTGTVTLATPEVTASADYSTRTGTNTTSGTISRTTTTPTLFTYNRTTTTVTTDDFGVGSTYTDTSSTATATSVVTANYNIITAEDFTRTVTNDVVDTMTASEAYAPYTRVSNGVYGSIGRVDSAIVTATTSKDITLTAHSDYSAQEQFTKTTPTTFTYDRVVTTTTADTFGTGSVYSDVSTSSSASSVVTGNYDVVTTEYDPLSARVDYSLSARTDQGKVTTNVHSLINRNTEFGKGIVYKYYDTSIAGYSGHTNQYGIGYNKDIAGDMNLGFGINKINTSLSGNKSNMSTDAVQIGATLTKEVKGFDLRATVQHSWIDYDMTTTPTLSITGSGDSRLLPSYAIVGTRTVDAGVIKTSPSGTDSSVMFRATGPGAYIRPVVGATLGYRRVDSYTTRWDIAPGISVENKTGRESETYHWATFGATAKYNMFNATALIHTDGVQQYGIGLEKSKDKFTFNVRADRLETKDGGSNLYTANMIYQF